MKVNGSNFIKKLFELNVKSNGRYSSTATYIKNILNSYE